MKWTLTPLSPRFVSPGGDIVFEGLRQMVRHLADHPEIGCHRPEERGFLEALKQWRSRSEMASVWRDGLRNAYWNYQPLFLLQAIRQVSPGSYLKLLEEVALPPALWLEFGARQGLRDHDELLALLAAAPLCASRDDAGRLLWNRKIAAPMLLEAAVEALQQDPGASAEKEDLDRAARELAGKLAAVLMDRGDAWFLAPQWLGYLISEEKRESTRGLEYWRPTRAVIDVLAEAMATKGGGLTQVREAFDGTLTTPRDLDAMRQYGRGEGDGRREISAVDAFLVAVLLDQDDARDNRPSESTQLLEVYEGLLIRRDQGLYTFEDAAFPTWRNWYPALYYARLPDPALAWSKTWALLSEQRRRARHRVDDLDADDPSFFHACVGMTVVDWLLDGETRDLRKAEECWDRVFDAVFSTALSTHFIRARRWRHLLAKAFARLPHLYTGPAAQIAAERMAERIAALGGDDELIAWACAMVSANGGDLALLASDLRSRGIELGARLRDFADWEVRPGYRHPLSPLAERAREMAGVLR